MAMDQVVQRLAGDGERFGRRGYGKSERFKAIRAGRQAGMRWIFHGLCSLSSRVGETRLPIADATLSQAAALLTLEAVRRSRARRISDC